VRWEPIPTPDGRWVLSTDSVDGIRRVSMDGGTSEAVTGPALEALGMPIYRARDTRLQRDSPG
jgi:hypothetical protein